MKRTRLLAYVAVAGVVAVTTGCVAQRLSIAQDLAAAATPYTAAPERPTRRLLVVGDSTGVGTGAAHPQDSLAGRISTAHPAWLIDNHAENGAKFEDIAAQFDRPTKAYDLVLVLAGGNDVIRLTPADELQASIVNTVRMAQARAPVVVLMPSGNVGHSPFFPPPVSWWMSHRSKALHTMVQKIASEPGVRYVRLLKPADADPFALEPTRMHAADGLHPSSDGYAQWFQELERQGALAPAPS